MGKYEIRIIQEFNSPIEPLFGFLTDHERFGRLIKADITRIKESPDPDKNGIGSVRRISLFPGIYFEETVVGFEQNQSMVYEITKGSPVKDHRGRLRFSRKKEITRLEYTIEYNPRLPFILLGPFLKKAIEYPIKKGLKQLASSAPIAN